jgi:membrane-associated phospholipid phosphatase
LRFRDLGYIPLTPFFVLTAPLYSQNGEILAVVNPLSSADHQLAGWFHAHLSHPFVNLLRAFSEPGSAEWIAIVLFFGVIFLLWKRAWPALITTIVAVPGGMLLNELIKAEVHRHRPFVDGWFVDWSGYSFASGHTIGATLLYGQLLLFLLPLIKSKQGQKLTILFAAVLVVVVGFSRIALGAHYLSDVLAAIFLGLLWLMICAVVLKPMRHSGLARATVAVQESRPTTDAASVETVVTAV